MNSKKVKNISNISKGAINSLFTYVRHARAPKESLVKILREHFYEPSMFRDLEAAVNYAMDKTACEQCYRAVWEDLCLVIGCNTYCDLADNIASRAKNESVRSSAALFYHRALLLAEAKLERMFHELQK